jgi:hypothetical protein
MARNLSKAWPALWTTTTFAVLAFAGLTQVATAAGGSSTAQCGLVRSRALDSLHAAPYGVFTYRYPHCARARQLVTVYLRRIRDVASCDQEPRCVRRIGGWKCRVVIVHGTVVDCVPRGAAWDGTTRPFVGVEWIA